MSDFDLADIDTAEPEINFISDGARLARAAWNDFGPRVATATPVYERAKKKLKISPQDRKDFDAALLRIAREHRSLISSKVLHR